ncbi:brachyurin-like, partial [Vanessa tameamea]|uniref:Brachyurin-like n=1 Tax=Vanessa tameamea TaxID=334116 RepID=A0ABM4AL61_VANTA
YTMSILLVTSLLVSSVWCQNEGLLGWHLKVGIKEAQRIREAENARHLLPFIVGGTVAPVNSHPYLAGLLIDVIGLNNPSACGGSLLTNTRILTAAHCWSDGRFQAWRMTAVLGSPYLYFGGTRIQSSTIAIHPDYQPQTLANDIAMLYLPVRVSFGSTIQPIGIPAKSFANFDFTGMWLQASGYGRYSDLSNPTTNTQVRNIFLEVISLRQCRSIFGSIVLDSNICTSGTGGVGICQGDSGGPLTVNIRGTDVVIGVSSFVAYDGCELGFPSAFARVTSYFDWIIMHT